jgi:hypothetical protein
MAPGLYGGSAFGAQHVQFFTPSWALGPMPPSPLNLEVLASSTAKPHITATVSLSVLRIQVGDADNPSKAGAQ